MKMELSGIFCIFISYLVTVNAAQLHHHQKVWKSNMPVKLTSPEQNSIPDSLPQNVNSRQVEEWVSSRLGAVEQRFNWKIHEMNSKLRKVNHTVDIAHLESVFYLVNEELQLSEERDANRDTVVQDLQNTITEQKKEIHHLKKRLGHLEDTLINLTKQLTGGDFSAQEKSSTHAGQNHLSSPVAPLYNNRPPTLTPNDLPKDCEQAYRNGKLVGYEDNIIQIRPYTSSTDAFQVRCNVKRDEGWTVIQRRYDGSVDFFKGWQKYKNGFGSLEGEFWLGLQKIHELTNQGNYKLRIDMKDWDGKEYWAEYDHFRVADEDNFYRLHVHGYAGNAGDSLTSRWENHNGQPFSTKDNDNDGRYYDNCAAHFKGAWWFTSCFESHLNGIYYQKGSHNNYFVRNGIQWNTIHVHSSLQSVEMMILPNENVVEPSEDKFVTGNDIE